MSTPPRAAAQGLPTRSSPSPSGGGAAAASAPAALPSRSSSPPSSPTSNSTASSSPSVPVTGSSGGGTPPSSSALSPSPPPSCAACRHQRRKCAPGCLLRPYFPADEPERFQNALALFGVKSMQRILRAVPPPRRDACMRTVVYESTMRRVDPVRGVSGVIQDLERELMDAAVELEVLRRRLESYRRVRQGVQVVQAPPNSPLGGHGADDPMPLAAVVQQQQQQGSYGTTPSPSMEENGFAAPSTQPRFSAVLVQLPRVQPPFDADTDGSAASWPRQVAREGTAAARWLDFSNVRGANDDKRDDPGHM